MISLPPQKHNKRKFDFFFLIVFASEEKWHRDSVRMFVVRSLLNQIPQLFLQGSVLCGFIKLYTGSDTVRGGPPCVLFCIQDLRRGNFFSLEVLCESLRKFKKSGWILRIWKGVLEAGVPEQAIELIIASLANHQHSHLNETAVYL